tara:strand:- start:118 stop:225 length:108 start_codon:yes stop_codon:yes gene_type:complete
MVRIEIMDERFLRNKKLNSCCDDEESVEFEQESKN